MKKIHAAITGIQGYVPEYILNNKELEKLVDTNDEWITTRTGIKERRILKGQKGSSEMGVKAIEGLLKKTNTSAKEILPVEIKARKVQICSQQKARDRYRQ